MLRGGEFVPIRVLQVVTQMNRAGMESRLMDIYRHLDRTKVQFDFYTFRSEEGQFDQEIMSMGANVYYNQPIEVRHMYHNRREFKKFLQDHPEYKIVHVHMNAWCGLLLKAAKEVAIPVRIAHSRTALDQIMLKNIAKNIIKVTVNRYATHRFAVSRKAGVWLFGKRAEKKGLVEVWPNAIEFEKFHYDPELRKDIRQVLDVSNNFVLMHVGNYRFEKNHQFLLRVFASVKKMDPSAKLVLVGGGDWTDIRKKAEQMSIADSVIFTGSRPDVERLLQAGDVFVFPSLYEGMPGAVLEAQASGLPCIISDCITDEVCITPLVEQLSLTLSPEKWAMRILETEQITRENTELYFVKNGFDIKNLTEKLTRFYLTV